MKDQGVDHGGWVKHRALPIPQENTVVHLVRFRDECLRDEYILHLYIINVNIYTYIHLEYTVSQVAINDDLWISQGHEYLYKRIHIIWEKKQLDEGQLDEST